MDEKKLRKAVEERTKRLLEAIEEKAKKALKETLKKKQRERAEKVKQDAGHLKKLKAYKDFFKEMAKNELMEALLFELASNKLAFIYFNLLKDKLGTNASEDFEQVNQICEEYIETILEGLTNRILAENMPELKEELDRKFRELGQKQTKLNAGIEKLAKERGSALPAILLFASPHARTFFAS